MIRDALKNVAYFDRWIDFYAKDIEHKQQFSKQQFADESYRPQYVYKISEHCLSLLLQRYSRGDPIAELPQYFDPLVHHWEEAERLGKHVWTEKQQYTRHAWAVNLDHYIDCFWLVGLGLALDISDDLWQRLLALVGNEGEDELLDRVIARRQPDRKIGTKLCYPKPYRRLLEAVNAPKDRQAQLLFAFVDKWYAELNRPPKKGLSEQTAMYDRPYWYTYHTLEGGYFGYWCVEAVAAVKAFGLDDSLCLGHPNYPGDLLRPDGPTTHVAQPQERSTSAQQRPEATGAGEASVASRLARLFHKR